VRVFINCLSVTNEAGIGRYSRTLLAGVAKVATADRVFLYVRRESDLSFLIPPDNFEVVPSAGPDANRWLLEYTDLPRAVEKTEAEAYFNPDFTVSPLIKCARRVATVHDLIPFTHPRSISFRARHLYRHFIPITARHATRMIADSRFTLARLSERFPDSRRRAVVIAPPLSGAFVRATKVPAEPHPFEAEGLRPRGKYLLYVGSAESRKNLARLMRAVEKLTRSCKFDGRVALVGNHRCWREFEHQISGATDVELAWLYSNAIAVVLVSLEEGFGYPVAEGFCFGAPAVVTRGSAMAEICPEGSVAVDPLKVDDIARGIVEVQARRDELASAVAARFSAQNYAPEAQAEKVVEAVTG
jgi:glycosyltransferase involved in cell wall biosynthesis